jgi:hypothetical protein
MTPLLVCCNTGGFDLSRSIIRDIVVPIIAKIMSEDRQVPPYRVFDIRDEHLEEFLEEELRRRFGLIGANECQHLREQIEEAKKNDPYALEFLLKVLLEKYVKLSVKARCAKKLGDVETGPPDRFSELRKKHNPYSVIDESSIQS